MHSLGKHLAAGLATGALLFGLAAAGAAAEDLNLYSARHYQTDEALYENFTKETGIKINRIEGKDDALIARLESEGTNSPADVLITVDAGRLWRAEQAGLFQPLDSKVLEERIPANLRDPEGRWFGFSTRARIIFYNKDLVKDPPQTYEALADPKYKGLVCIRSSSNIYNLSLMASMIAHHGEEKALAWAKGVVQNFARPPQGGDTDQLTAAAAGECGIALANTYYFVRLAESDDAKDKAAVEKLGWVWPNQEGRGAHVNVSGAGVLKHAPHPDAARKFLLYLASEEAQRYFAEGNNEYPAVSDVEPSPELKALGSPKVDEINVAVYGENQPQAQMLFDRAGWK